MLPVPSEWSHGFCRRSLPVVSCCGNSSCVIWTCRLLAFWELEGLKVAHRSDTAFLNVFHLVGLVAIKQVWACFGGWKPGEKVVFVDLC